MRIVWALSLCACVSTAQPDAGSDAEVTIDPANCVPPLTQSNDDGVGGYCTPGGHECGSPAICTADFDASAHAWFCTAPCSAGCGVGATCVSEMCVPNSCLVPADGGLD